MLKNLSNLELEIHIVDHCNLNCSSCNNFAPLADKFFITEEDFFNQITLVKKTLPMLSRLIITGGEATLHPNLFNLCNIARTIFPNIIIDVLTNGIILNNWENDILQKYSDLNINFFITKYPRQNYSNLDNKKQNFTNIQIKDNIQYLFSSSLIDLNGKSENKYCQKYNLPCLTLKDYKIFICPFSAHLNIYCNKKNIQIKNNDFILLDENLNIDKLKEFCLSKKNICNYCFQKIETRFWNKNFYADEYIKDSKELFLNDYQTYNLLFNQVEKIDINNINFLVDESFNKYLQTRLKGKIDIIIPYYKIDKYLLRECFLSLTKQTFINDCMIYLISDDSPDEEHVFELFNTFKGLLNLCFLKTEKNSGPGVARNLAIEKSYNKYIFFLDSDDYLNNENLLEKLFNYAENNKKYDIIEGNTLIYNKSQDKFYYSNMQHCCLFKRESLIKNNIKFSESFIAEDFYFFSLISLYNLKIKKINIDGYIYNKQVKTSINSEKNPQLFFINRILMLFNCIIENINNKNIISLVSQFLSMNDLQDLIDWEFSNKISETNSLIEPTYNFIIYLLLLFENKLNFSIKNNINNLLIQTNFKYQHTLKYFIEYELDFLKDFNFLYKNFENIIKFLYKEKTISQNQKNFFLQKGVEFLNVNSK